MTQFIVFAFGFLTGAWIALLIVSFINISHEAEERERKSWERRYQEKEREKTE